MSCAIVLCATAAGLTRGRTSKLKPKQVLRDTRAPFRFGTKAQLIPDLLYNAKLKRNEIHLPPKKEDQDPCSPGICSFITKTKDIPSRSVITVVL